MDVLKMIDLQYKGYCAEEVAAQLGESAPKVRRVARDIGCPFTIWPARNYPCIDCRTPNTVTYNERTCGGCRKKQRKHGVGYVETYDVPGVGA